MSKLILEEGGQRRAFRVNKGRLTIGSGEACTLTLSSKDVAEVHAELEVSEKGVVLVPRPGVMPPMLGGRPVKAPALLVPGAQFRIGEARFTLEGEAKGPAAVAARTVAATASKVASGSKVSSAPTARKPSPVQPSRPLRKIERGVPTWAILAICGLVLVAGFGFFRMFFKEASKVEFDPYERLRVANLAYAEAANDRALQELDRVNLERAPELAPQVAELRKKISERGEAAALVAYNATGTEVYNTQLKRFFDQRMQGDNVPRERARVFVQRCRDFLERWPQHPEASWVARYQTRFEPIAQLSEPATITDISFDVETLTWAKPRDYKLALARLRDFMATAGGADFDAAKAVEDKLVADREDYFIDRMQQAKYHWNKDEPGKAVGELVQLIVYIGDKQMEDQAAREMVELPRIDEHLLGYKNNRSGRFEELMQNGIVRAKAVEHGLL